MAHLQSFGAPQRPDFFKSHSNPVLLVVLPTFPRFRVGLVRQLLRTIRVGQVTSADDLHLLQHESIKLDFDINRPKFHKRRGATKAHTSPTHLSA